MSDLLKSAFGYFNNSAGPGGDNDFVGQTVGIGNVNFLVKRVIAEGGFAFIYVVQDPNTGKEYALKRLLASVPETNAVILQEINILKKLSGHPNIVQYLAAVTVDKSESSCGKNEYLLLTEYCPRGNLVECLANKKTPLPPDVVCRIFWQTCKAVQHMHSQVPPVIHRDLKMDNLLISADGVIKLCDFGSCTLKTLKPDPSWSSGQRSLLEDEVAKVTTPMYRAPEMIDTWNNHPIGPPCDIWALGCILYSLCFMSHPFSDAAKLKILNGNYNIPTGDSKYAPFHDIIRGCLQVNPETRMTIYDALERLAAISESMGYDMKEPLTLEANQNDATSTAQNNVPPQRQQSEQKPVKSQTGRPPPPQSMPNPTPPHRPEPPSVRDYPAYRPDLSSQPKGNPTNNLFSSIKGGAGNFFKNLKDTSSKVMQTVHQSIARSDLDISYISSRILVMPFPADGLELAYKSNHVEDVRAFLEARHPCGRYCVYNLSGRSYPPTRLGSGRIVDAPFGGFRRVPPLHIIYNLCSDMVNFLERDKRNVVVIHCTNGKASSAILVASLLMYTGMMEKYDDALQMFAVRRTPPDLQPSETRYLKYLGYIMNIPPFLPHCQPVTLVSITLQPVPLFTKQRDGCRPYVELYQGDERIKSTLTDYDKMKIFHIFDGKVVLPLNMTVCGDITISIYHARQNLGGVMSSGKPTGLKICQFQFHTGFIQEDHTSLKYLKCELDDIGENDHYPDSFNAVVNIFVCDYAKKLRPMPWESPRKPNAEILFQTPLEMEETYDNFVTKPTTFPKNMIKTAVPPPRPEKPPSAATKMSTTPKESGEEVERLVQNVTEEADLLSINKQPSSPSTNTVVNNNSVAKQESVDLLGLGLDSPNESNNKPDPASKNATSNAKFSELDALFKTEPVSSALNANAGDLFDPFGSEPVSGAENLLNPDMWSNVIRPNVPTNAAGLPRNSSTPNLEQKNKDALFDFGNLGSNLNIPMSASKPVTPMGGSPNVQSPVHRPPSQMYGTPPTQPMQPARTPGGSPIHQAKSPSETRAPDYSRSHFDSAFGKKQTNDKGNKPTGDIFGDLLGSQGYDFASKKDNSPRTMNQLRKEDLVKELDPDRVKVLEWTEGKKGNIRALLCSINMVLWEDCKWKGVDMSQLVSPADVKKAYRKACLAVHPDKQVGTPNENIAKLVFVELNNAWSDFESDGNQQNLFAT